MSDTVLVFGDGPTGQAGRIHSSGEIRDQYGFQRGRITVEGTLRDQNGRLIGNIHNNGQFSNFIGRTAQLVVSPSGEIRINNEQVGRVQIAWGMKIPNKCIAFAAAYLLNRPTWVWS